MQQFFENCFLKQFELRLGAEKTGFVNGQVFE